ncbi:MAG: hypothetical protein KF777_14445 [Planctomycetaceae bacterium]|nr:hypothetical protein [Planctomycetaceae bacterium]
MQSVSNDNFGLLIAYVIPGFVTVWASSIVSPQIAGWLGNTSPDAPTVSGFLYVTVASVMAGMLISAGRWLLVDQWHHRTGIKPPVWDFSRFHDQAGLFLTVVEHQYRYYQFYSGSLIAVLYAYAIRRYALAVPLTGLALETFGLLLIVTLLYAASRDTLRKYYTRLSQLHDAAAVPWHAPEGVNPAQSNAGSPTP